jgi:serine protease Do
VATVADSGLNSGKAGLVKFRDTEAEFRAFRVGDEVPRATVPQDEAERIVGLIEKLPGDESPDEALLTELAADPVRAAKVLRSRAAELDQQAEQLRKLALAAHERRVIDDLLATLAAEEANIDLFRAGLLIARLDNEEVDVDAYCCQLDEMAAELTGTLGENSNDAEKLAALKKYLFEENGFHGSRGDFYNRSNSYLNEVLDDREGLPITLSVVYMELGRRIGLNVVGVGLPGHFVVSHVPAKGEPQLIDVFEGAVEVGRADAEKRINETTDGELSAAQMEELFKPATKRAIALRMLQNLLPTARTDPPVLHRYLNAVLAIDPQHGPYHMLRAMVRYQLDEKQQAREDVNWLLEHEPVGVNLDQVRALEVELDRE